MRCKAAIWAETNHKFQQHTILFHDYKPAQAQTVHLQVTIFMTCLFASAVFWKIVAYLQSNKQTSDSITITEFSSVKLMENYFCISIIVAMKKKTFFHFFFCRVLLFLPPVPVQQQAWTGRGWRVFWAESINTPRPLGESGCPWCSCSACWCLWWRRRGFGVTRAKTLCATLGR